MIICELDFPKRYFENLYWKFKSSIEDKFWILHYARKIWVVSHSNVGHEIWWEIKMIWDKNSFFIHFAWFFHSIVIQTSDSGFSFFLFLTWLFSQSKGVLMKSWFSNDLIKKKKERLFSIDMIKNTTYLGSSWFDTNCIKLVKHSREIKQKKPKVIQKNAKR